MDTKIEKLTKLIRETIDEKGGGTIHVNSATASNLKPYLYHDEELEQTNAIGLYYGSQVIVDDTIKDDIAEIWN